MVKMKKSIFLAIAFLSAFLIAASASADPGFNFIGDFVNSTTGSAATITPSFTVNNTGTTGLNINFSGLALTKGIDLLEIGLINNISNLANGSSQLVSFSIEVQKQQNPGLYNGTLTANSNASNSDTISFRVNVTPTYDASASISEINLGTARLNTTFTKSFNITNTGNANITNASFTFTESQANFKASKENFVLPFNKTETIDFNITIPPEFSTGNVTIGTVRLSSPSKSNDLFKISADVGGGLIIEDLDVFLTTRKSESENHLDILDGDELRFGDEEAGPGSELRFNFNIENTFDKDEDIDIKDATILITIQEIDDGEDMEEESSQFEVNADTAQEVDVIVNIPLHVEEGNYDILIELSGEDDNGNTHTAEMQAELEISKDSTDIGIGEASINPSTIKCSGSATVSATLVNFGTRAQEDLGLQIINEELGVDFTEWGIGLSEDPFDDESEFSKTQRIEIPKGAKAGTYPIEIRAYITEGGVWERKNVNLNVVSCPESKEILEEEENNAVEGGLKGTEQAINDNVQADSNETGSDKEEISVLQPDTSKELPLTQRAGFWAVIIAINIAAIGAIAFFVNSLSKR